MYATNQNQNRNQNYLAPFIQKYQNGEIDSNSYVNPYLMQSDAPKPIQPIPSFMNEQTNGLYLDNMYSSSFSPNSSNLIKPPCFQEKAPTPYINTFFDATLSFGCTPTPFIPTTQPAAASDDCCDSNVHYCRPPVKRRRIKRRLPRPRLKRTPMPDDDDDSSDEEEETVAAPPPAPPAPPQPQQLPPTMPPTVSPWILPQNMNMNISTRSEPSSVQQPIMPQSQLPYNPNMLSPVGQNIVGLGAAGLGASTATGPLQAQEPRSSTSTDLQKLTQDREKEREQLLQTQSKSNQEIRHSQSQMDEKLKQLESTLKDIKFNPPTMSANMPDYSLNNGDRRGGGGGGGGFSRDEDYEELRRKRYERESEEETPVENIQLEIGQSVICSNSTDAYFNVYRFDGNNTLRPYHNSFIADSWDPNWRSKGVHIDCTGYMKGNMMELNKSSTPTPSSTPGPTYTSTPGPTYTSTPGPTYTSTPGPTYTSTPGPTYTSTPGPTYTTGPSVVQVTTGGSVRTGGPTNTGGPQK